MSDDRSESFATLLLPGWRHAHTGKIHIRRDCRAVQFYADNMNPILVRLDDETEVTKVITEGERCGYCFRGFPSELPPQVH